MKNKDAIPDPTGVAQSEDNEVKTAATNANGNNCGEQVQDPRVKAYISKVGRIEKGNRNKEMHNLGLCLRGTLGLTGDALEATLQEANQEKCDPPLLPEEIQAIARSVDKAKVPLGEPVTARNRRSPQKAPVPKYRTVSAVTASADPVPVADLLSKQVSFYHSFEDKTPGKTMTIGKFLDDCKDGFYSKLVDVVRAEPNKEKRNALKKELLPCITPHCNPAEGKTKEACEKAGWNGVISIDYDDIPEDDIASAMMKVLELPYVFAAVRSASGRGFFVLAAYEGEPDWDTLLVAIQAGFSDYTIDMNSKGIYRLRFVTVDENLLIKSGEIFPAVLVERQEPVEESKPMVPNQKHEEWDEMFGTALTAKEIMDTDWGELEWVVDGLIPEGLTIFAGQSKIGKSWFLLQLALRVITKLPFLKTLATNRYEVLYLALEDKERRMKSRLERLNLPVNGGLKIIHTWKDQWEALDYLLEKNPKVKVVIIDTWGRFVAGVCKDNNDYAEITALAARLHELAKKHKAAIIAVTHTKKGAQAGDWIDNAIGSKALVAVADTVLSLSRERHSEVGTLCITGRDVEEKEFTIEHDDNWVWRLSNVQGLTSDQRRILDYLKKSRKGQTTRDLTQNVTGFSKKGGSDRMADELRTLQQKELVFSDDNLWHYCCKSQLAEIEKE